MQTLALDPARSIVQFRHKSWTVADGMPADIWAITQTRDGYLWLGSVTGLYRFDGVKVERVAAEQLSSPSIHALVALPSGGLWVGYERPVGVISLLQDGVVTNFPINAPSSTGIHRIALARDGGVWASTPDTILKFDGKKWQAIDDDWGTSLGERGGGVRAFAIAGDGVVWSKNLRGVFYLRPGAGHFVPAAGYLGGPEGFAATRDGRIWTADSKAHSVYALPDLAGAQGDAAPAPTASMAATQPLEGPILLDRDGTLWCASYEGLCRIRNPKGPATSNQGTTVVDRFTHGEGLSSNLVHTLFEDREGNIWVGTSLGLDRFSPANVVTETGVPVGFKARFVTATTSSLYAYTGWSNTRSRATDGSESLYRILPHSAPEVVARNIGRLRGMFVSDDSGAVWLTTLNGVQRLVNGALAPPIALPDGVAGDLVYSATEDKSGALWISAFGKGVYRRENGAWTAVPVHSQFAATAVLVADPTGAVWIRYSGGGLYRARGAQIQDFSHSTLDIGDITLIKPYARGLVIGGESGIAIFDGQKFYSLRASNLPVLSVITGIAQTRDGSTWIFTQAGVLRVAIANLEFALRHSDASALQYDLIDSRDGLPGAPYGALNGSTTATGPDGRVWFTTGQGLVWIDPNNLYHNKLAPPVVIRALTENGRTYLPSSALKLAAGTSNLEIDYTALSLSVPERVPFRYMLEGVDDGWVDAGARREAFYTRLAPGHYRFHVIAANNDGVWNTTGATLAFSIPPTFVQSRTFLALCIFAGTALLWVAYRTRLAQVSARVQLRLESRLSERERIARDLHDTLLQGFQALMLRFQSVAYSIPADQPARQLLENAMLRADQVLYEGRDRIKDLRNAQLADDLPRALRDVARDFAQDSSASFRVLVQGPCCSLNPAMCDELVLICSEAIRNAFKHANAENIEVEITYDCKYLQVLIRDDGKGIDPAVLGAERREGHFGLIGMRERAQRIGAELTLSSRPNAGTEVEIVVPGNRAYVRHPSGHRRAWRSVLMSNASAMPPDAHVNAAPVTPR